MPSRIEFNKNNFEITYEAPFGGVNLDAYEGDIDRGQFADTHRFNSRTYGIVPATIATYSNAFLNFQNPNNLGWTLTFTLNNLLVFIDGAGDVYYYDIPSNSMIKDGSIGAIAIDTYQIIGNVWYGFSFGNATETTISNVGSGSIINTAAVYAAGRYSMVLSNYLILGNTNQPSDNPAIKKNRINWSSPDIYTQFDPAADRNAGFNVLGDVSDEITGMFVQGNVGYIIRTQGITQVTPTGDPLAPFAFTPLWSSDFGVGTIFSRTISSYGAMTVFMGSGGSVWLFQGGGIQDISYGIRTDLQDAGFNNAFGTDPQGVIFTSNYGTNLSTVRYGLLVDKYSSSGAGSQTIYIYDFHFKFWSKYLINNGIPVINFFKRNSKIVPGPIGPVISTDVCIYALMAARSNGNDVGSLFEESFDNCNDIQQEGYFTFKLEEFKLKRTVTIRRIIVKAIGNGQLNIAVSPDDNSANSQNFSNISVTDNTKVKMYTSSGTWTGYNMQMIISSNNFFGRIVKIMIAGTYADGDLL